MKNELFKSIHVNRDSLFSPHAHKTAVHKRSSLGLYQPIMTKDSAVNKLTNDRCGCYKNAIKEKEQLVNVLQRQKEKKARYNGSTTIIDTQIQPLLAEIDALKLKQQQLDSGRQELLKYVLSQRGGIVPSEKILSFIGGKVPIPVPTIAPEIPPEAESIDVPSMGGSNFLPVQAPPTNIEQESETGASLPTETTVPPEPIQMPPETDTENESGDNSPYISPESDIGDAGFRPLFLQKKYNKENPDLETTTEDSEYEPPPKLSRKEQLMQPTKGGGYISSTMHPKSEKAKDKAHLRLTEKAHPIGSDTDAEQLSNLLNITKTEAKKKIKEAHPLGKEEPEEQPASGDEYIEPTEKGYKLKEVSVKEKVADYEKGLLSGIKSNAPTAKSLTDWARAYERDNGKFPDLWRTRQQYNDERKGHRKNYVAFLRTLAIGNKEYEKWKKLNKK